MDSSSFDMNFNDKPEVCLEEYANENDPVSLDSIEETDPGKFIYAITLAVALGGCLFGYDSGVISGVLITIGTDLGKDLTTGEKELITSIMSAGAFFGGIFGGMVIDRIGRRIPLMLASVFFFHRLCYSSCFFRYSPNDSRPFCRWIWCWISCYDCSCLYCRTCTFQI